MSSIECALEMAKSTPHVRGRQRHFAMVLCKRGRVVSSSANSYVKTSPRAFKAAKKLGLDEKCYLHAEQRALYLDKARKGVKLIVVRVGANGEAMNSEPCVVCKQVLLDFPNIRSIEYSTGE